MECFKNVTNLKAQPFRNFSFSKDSIIRILGKNIVKDI